MGPCLGCKQACSDNSVFCDECRSLLQDEHKATDVSAAHISSRAASSTDVEETEVRVSQVRVVEDALHLLTDAARRIALVEQNIRRKPRVSRLTPLSDISADIQRHSTPMPRAS